MAIDLKALRYCEAVARHGSFTKAAEDLRIAQPALSIAIKKLETELGVVQTLHKAGVPFLAGTDTPPGVYIFPGFSLHEELQRFVDAGFTPLDALQTATINPARFFGAESQFGTVEEGRFADLVMLTANPLENIANTKKIVGVIVNGQYLYGKQLDKLLSGVEATAAKQK